MVFDLSRLRGSRVTGMEVMEILVLFEVLEVGFVGSEKWIYSDSWRIWFLGGSNVRGRKSL